MSEETPAKDSTAMSLALSGASRDKADAFLDQMAEDMREENPLKLSHLRLRRISDLGRIAFQASLGILAMALVVAVGAMVWNAAHSESVLIESFSVPPDMEARGITGQVVASQLLDKLTFMQNETVTSRIGQSFAGGWGDDIKVEIPQTGVSIGEAYRFLKNWLGHDTRIGGEVIRTATGIAITARTGSGSGGSFAGAESDLDALVQKAAEHVYRGTQTYRYGAYLAQHGRAPEALAVYKAMTQSGPPQERAWGYIGWNRQTSGNEDPHFRLWLLQRARALDPSNSTALNNSVASEFTVGLEEEGLSDMRKVSALSARDRMDNTLRSTVKTLTEKRIGSWMGAWRDEALATAEIIRAGTGGSYNNMQSGLALAHIGAHELAAARAAAAAINPQNVRSTPAQTEVIKARVAMALAAGAEDWAGAVAAAEAIRRMRLRISGGFANFQDESNLARAQARLGRFAAAEARIAATPGNCYACLWSRGRIAGLRGQHKRADYWFDRAVRDAPSFPTAHAEWGQALLERGAPGPAIEQFAIANRKGPKFADPLVGWGEALMAQNQSHLALAKFAAAEKFTPNWGRLHLKWGEALLYAGKKDEAKKQFAIAARLDLTPSEKSALARISR